MRATRRSSIYSVWRAAWIPWSSEKRKYYQVRSSFKTAQAEKTIGTIFNELFKQAVTVGKRTHAETDIGANAVSVSYAAVELAKNLRLIVK